MQGKTPIQAGLFSTPLPQLCRPEHELRQLADRIDWLEFEKAFGKLYSHTGRPSKPIRLMVSLLLLKQLYNLSDENVVARWTENPYWQLFSGALNFSWEAPCEPSDLVHFRNRIGKEGAEKIFKTSVEIHGKQAQEQDIVVDTTVQEKNVTFPTDTKLHAKIIQKCVKIADEIGLPLRRSYRRTLPQLLKTAWGGRSPAARKAAKKAKKKIKTIAGALVRELKREFYPHETKLYQRRIELFERVLAQEKNDKNKVYSLHEPEVACIAKGKVHKQYEFGAKAAIALTKTTGILVGAQSFTGNPYDGNTLESLLNQTETLTKSRPKRAVGDKGFRGRKAIGATEIVIPDAKSKSLTKYEKTRKRKLFRRRSAVEAAIGHLKNDFRMSRNYLKGVVGDSFNLMMAAAAFNFQKWMKIHFWPLFFQLFSPAFCLQPAPFFSPKIKMGCF